MFSKLKLQFILTNVTIVFTLFFLITAGAYLVLQANLINHAEFFTKRVADSINSGMFPELPSFAPPIPKPEGPQLPGRFGELPPLGGKAPYPPSDPGAFRRTPPEAPGMPKVFYVKINPAGEIFYQSAGAPIKGDQLIALVQKALKSSNPKGLINSSPVSLFFFKTMLRGQSGRLLVFQPFEAEKHMLRFLLLIMSGLGLACLFLSLCGSLFMAKWAIIPIQKAWEQQKSFIADASHELRTPLAIIQTNLEIVLNHPEKTVGSQNEWLVNIKEETQHMTNLVGSLLFLARADANQLLLNKSYFPINPIIIQVTEAFKPLAAEKRIHLIAEIKDQLTGYGDELRIRQVIEILLDNAIRHTPAEGKVTLNAAEIEKEIVIAVADNGEGIPAEHLDKIFDRFYQIDSSRSKGELGLGLSIAKCIIESHRGKIEVSSVPGSGTLFKIQLPLPRNDNR